jgi:hypothetical protein
MLQLHKGETPWMMLQVGNQLLTRLSEPHIATGKVLT